ncbi:MAG: tetratricopeptide repeat protein, partial [Planctomycetota bacterium]
EAAIKEFETAIDINPKSAEAYSNIGLIYCEKGMFDEAVTVLKKATEVDPTFPDAHNNLGYAYWNKGMKKKAMREVSIYKQLTGTR